MSSTRGSLPLLGCRSRTGSTSALSDRTTEGPRIQSWDDSSTWHLGRDDEALSDLYTRLAHIQWRKNANHRNIRRALDTTKHMYDRDMMLQLAYDREEERKQWTKAIICDELACTAEMPENFSREWEQREQDDRKRCLKEVALHLKSIKRVERALSSKWGADDNVTSLLDEETTTPAEGEQHRVLSGGGIDSSVELMDKLWALRREVEEKRRELRRAGKKRGGKEGGFRAANYKTGRGKL